MKILVIHGDDLIKSYERLQTIIDSLRKRDWEVIKFEQKGNLREILANQSLFQKKKAVVVEDIKVITQKDLNWLKKEKGNPEINLIIYNQGILNDKFLTKLPKDKIVEIYNLPKIVWSFLESFFPGNTRKALNLLHQSVKNEPLELIFALFARHIRDLFWIKTDAETINYPSWKITRLKKQASKFSKEKLKEIILKLSFLDIKVKNSQSELNNELDLLVVTQLESKD